MGSVGANQNTLTRDGNIIRTSNTDIDRSGLERFLYDNKLRPLSTKNGLEYGIVGTRRTRGRANNSNSGYIGYKIENGNVYIASFSPSSVTQATSWVREAINDSNYKWIKVGRL